FGPTNRTGGNVDETCSTYLGGRFRTASPGGGFGRPRAVVPPPGAGQLRPDQCGHVRLPGILRRSERPRAGTVPGSGEPAVRPAAAARSGRAPRHRDGQLLR